MTTEFVQMIATPARLPGQLQGCHHHRHHAGNRHQHEAVTTDNLRAGELTGSPPDPEAFSTTSRRDPFPPCRALAIGVDALYVFIFPAIPACGGLEGRTPPALLPKDNVPPGGSCPLRCGKRFLSPQASAPLPPHAAGRASRPYAMSLVPQRARGRSLRTNLSRAKSSSPASPAPQAEAPSATGKQNATPRLSACPVRTVPVRQKEKNALQGRDALPCRDKRPSLKASLVPLELFNLKRFT